MAEVSKMSGVRYLTETEAVARGYLFSVNDQVTAWGHWIGRVEYLLADGYVGVRGADGRLDEYRAADLQWCGEAAEQTMTRDDMFRAGLMEAEGYRDFPPPNDCFPEDADPELGG